MEIELLKSEKRVVTSEYVYLENGSTLCHIPDFQWTRNVEVHFVVSGRYDYIILGNNWFNFGCDGGGLVAEPPQFSYLSKYYSTYLPTFDLLSLSLLVQ